VKINDQGRVVEDVRVPVARAHDRDRAADHLRFVDADRMRHTGAVKPQPRRGGYGQDRNEGNPSHAVMPAQDTTCTMIV
jgi:hypothetical protein